VQTGEPFAGANAWDGALALLITDACVQSLCSGQPAAVHLPNLRPVGENHPEAR
jgi:hypothetical protein